MTTPAIDLAAIEKRLDEAIEFAESQGYRLEPHVTLDKERRRCCPMGAYVLLHAAEIDRPSVFWAYTDLGLDMRCGFVPGFDGTTPDREDYDPALYDLGKKYRDRALGAGD